jgi:hypothetical protein
MVMKTALVGLGNLCSIQMSYGGVYYNYLFFKELEKYLFYFLRPAGHRCQNYANSNDKNPCNLIQIIFYIRFCEGCKERFPARRGYIK